MNLMTYEETVPLIQASIYHNLQFYSEDQVLQVIDALPDDPYDQLPEGGNPDQHKANKQAQEQEAPLSSKEKNGLNKYAEGLCMKDNRKASAIAHYYKTVMFRDIDCQKCSTNRGCAYSSVLKQISNKNYVFDPQTGEEYSDLDFRRQVVLHCASKPEELYPHEVQYGLLLQRFPEKAAQPKWRWRFGCYSCHETHAWCEYTLYLVLLSRISCNCTGIQ